MCAGVPLPLPFAGAADSLPVRQVRTLLVRRRGLIRVAEGVLAADLARLHLRLHEHKDGQRSYDDRNNGGFIIHVMPFNQTWRIRLSKVIWTRREPSDNLVSNGALSAGRVISSMGCLPPRIFADAADELRLLITNMNMPVMNGRPLSTGFQITIYIHGM